MLVPRGCVWVIYPLSPLVSVALKSIGKVYMSHSLNALKGLYGGLLQRLFGAILGV